MMEAGRELDARALDAEVAEKVMGWAFAKSKHGHWRVYVPGEDRMREEGYGWAQFSEVDCGALNREWWEETEVPEFSTSIADAWKVVEKMRERGVYIDVECTESMYLSRAWWAGETYYDIWRQEIQAAEAAPEAICRVALAALEALK